MIFTYHHLLSGEETLAANNAVYAAPYADKFRYCIIDLRDIEEVDITPEQMNTLAQQDIEEASKNSELKVALVVANDLVRGVTNFYSIYVDSPLVEARVFSTMKEARSWIDGLIAAGAFGN